MQSKIYKGETVQNSCKFSLKPENKKNVKCVGPCEQRLHYKCLEYSPEKIKGIKESTREINFLCPDCNTADPQENIANGMNSNRNKKHSSDCQIFTQPETKNFLFLYSEPYEASEHVKYLDKASDNIDSNKHSFETIWLTQHYETSYNYTLLDSSKNCNYYEDLAECWSSVESRATQNQPSEEYASYKDILYPYIAINQNSSDCFLPIQRLHAATNQILNNFLSPVQCPNTIKNQTSNTRISSIGNQSLGTYHTSNDSYPSRQISSYELLFATERPSAKKNQNSVFSSRSYIVAYSIPQFTPANQLPSSFPYMPTQYFFTNQLPCNLPGVFYPSAFSPFIVSSVLPPFLMSQPPCIPFQCVSYIPYPWVNEHVKENKNESSPMKENEIKPSSDIKNSQNEIPMRRCQLRQQKKQLSGIKCTCRKNYPATNIQSTICPKYPKQFHFRNCPCRRNYSTTNTQSSVSPRNLKRFPGTKHYGNSRHLNKAPDSISISTDKKGPEIQPPTENNQRQHTPSYKPQELFTPMNRPSCPLACPYNPINRIFPPLFLRPCRPAPPAEPEKKIEPKRREWKCCTGSKPRCIPKNATLKCPKQVPKYQPPYPPSLRIIERKCHSINLPPCPPLFLRPCPSSPPSPKKPVKKRPNTQYCGSLKTPFSSEHTFVNPPKQKQLHQIPRLIPGPCPSINRSCLVSCSHINPSSCLFQGPCPPMNPSSCLIQSPCHPINPSSCLIQSPCPPINPSPCLIQSPCPPINPSSCLFPCPPINQPPSLIRVPCPLLNLPPFPPLYIGPQRRSSLKKASYEQPLAQKDESFLETQKTRSSSVKPTVDELPQSRRSSVSSTVVETPKSPRSSVKTNVDEAPQSRRSSIKTAVVDETQSRRSSVKLADEDAPKSRRSSVMPTVDGAPPSGRSSVTPTINEAPQGRRSSVKTTVDEAPQSRRSSVKITIDEAPQSKHSSVNSSANEVRQSRRSSIKTIVDEAPQRRRSSLKRTADEIPQSRRSSLKQTVDETPKRRRSSVKRTVVETPQSRRSSVKSTVVETPRGRRSSLKQPFYKSPSESQQRGTPSPSDSFKSIKQSSAVTPAEEPSTQIQLPSRDQIEAPADQEEEPSHVPTILKPHIPSAKPARTPMATTPPSPTVKPPRSPIAQSPHMSTAEVPRLPKTHPQHTPTAKPLAPRPPAPVDMGPKFSDNKDSNYSQTVNGCVTGEFMSKFINAFKDLAGQVNNAVECLAPPGKMDSCQCSRWIYNGRYTNK